MNVRHYRFSVGALAVASLLALGACDINDDDDDEQVEPRRSKA